MHLLHTPWFFKWLFPLKTWGVSSSDSVYLTFDDGPDPEVTNWVLRFLSEHQIKATFFLIGKNIERNPFLLTEILAQGHAVGNHTMCHEHGLKTPLKQYLSSVEFASKLVNSKLFRPPYGRISPLQTWRLSRKYNIIMWSWLSYDFDATKNIEEILNSVSKIKPGSILVFHDSAKAFERLKIILPEVVRMLHDKKLAFKVLPN
jgi:peptidoglycan-N-acetylglucosamine deacetylase